MCNPAWIALALVGRLYEIPVSGCLVRGHASEPPAFPDAEQVLRRLALVSERQSPQPSVGAADAFSRLRCRAQRTRCAALRLGYFPDGLVFEIPDSDPAPEPLSLRDLFSPTDSEILLYLAVPSRGDKGSDTDLANGSESRFGTFERVLKDETISEDEYAVTLGRKNFVLCSGSQLRPGWVSFAIARIRRDGKGSFVSDESFLPPLLRIGVNDDLLHRTRHTAPP